MSDLPSRVQINEDGPREGIQIETAVIPTEGKIALIDALAQTGLSEIQTVSFVSPRRVPQWADAEAVVAGLTPREGVRYTGLYLNEQGLKRAIDTGRLEIEGGISLCASPAFLQRNQNTTPEGQREIRRRMVDMFRQHGVPVNRIGVSAAFGCNFQGDIPLEQLLGTVAEAFGIADECDLTIDSIGLSDTMGWATPVQITRTVGVLRETYPDQRVSLHLHNTRGLAMANAYAGLMMGVADFDSSIGGIGGCPFAAHKGAAGNLCTEDFAFMCDELGIETGLDLDALIAASELAEKVVGHPLPGSVRRGGTLKAVRERVGAA